MWQDHIDHVLLDLTKIFHLDNFLDFIQIPSSRCSLNYQDLILLCATNCGCEWWQSGIIRSQIDIDNSIMQEITGVCLTSLAGELMRICSLVYFLFSFCSFLFNLFIIFTSVTKWFFLYNSTGGNRVHHLELIRTNIHSVTPLSFKASRGVHF